MPAPNWRIVDQLAGVLGQQPYEFRKFRQLLNVSDIPQIARQHRREIGPRPVLPPALAVATDRFGEAAEQDSWVRSSPRIASRWLRSFPAKRCSRKVGVRPSTSALASGSIWMVSIRPASCRRPAARSGRSPSREKEATRPIVLVDRLLDGQQQIRGALNFVYDGPVEATNEAGGIGLGSLEDRLIVERDIGPPGFSIFRTSVVLPARAGLRSGPLAYQKGLPPPVALQTARTCHLRIRKIGTIGSG